MSTSTLQGQKSDAITLQGSAELIGEFFKFGINSILFQRGIYPYETFKKESAYGIPVYMTNNPELSAFLENFVNQLKVWLVKKTIQGIVIDISDKENLNLKEKWKFKIECDKTADENTKQTEKPLKEIQKEIKYVIRQIVSSVTFLPHLDGLITFNILVYTDKDCEVPVTWEDGEDQVILNSEQVKLNSFSSLLHKVGVEVSYKVD